MIFHRKNTGVFLLGLVFFASCSKDISSRQPDSTEAGIALQASAENLLLSDTAIIRFFKAPFNSRGSTTDFRGLVSDTTAIISLDFFIEKKFAKAGNGKVALGYGDARLYNKGWKYEISFDNGQIVLAPNSVMAAAIVPGSFNVVAATFDRVSGTFTFFTEVKETSNNIVHQVTEIITRQ